MRSREELGLTFQFRGRGSAHNPQEGSKQQRGMTRVDVCKLVVGSPVRFHLRRLRSGTLASCVMVVAAGMERREWVGGVCVGRNVSELSHISYLPVSLGRRLKRRGFSNPGSGRSPGGGHGNPLQGSCLENPVHKSLVGCSP